MPSNLPNGTVCIVCAGIPWTRGGENQIIFDSPQDQIDYFESMVKRTGYYYDDEGHKLPSELNYRNMSYQRVSHRIITNGYETNPRVPNTIRVPIHADYLRDCNYVCFNNNNGNTPSSPTQTQNGKWFYAFIDKVSYINPKCSEIEYTIDSWQTYMFDIDYNDCQIVRETQQNNTIFNHEDMLIEAEENDTYLAGSERITFDGLVTYYNQNSDYDEYDVFNQIVFSLVLLVSSFNNKVKDKDGSLIFDDDDVNALLSKASSYDFKYFHASKGNDHTPVLFGTYVLVLYFNQRQANQIAIDVTQNNLEDTIPYLLGVINARYNIYSCIFVRGEVKIDPEFIKLSDGIKLKPTMFDIEEPANIKICNYPFQYVSVSNSNGEVWRLRPELFSNNSENRGYFYYSKSIADGLMSLYPAYNGNLDSFIDGGTLTNDYRRYSSMSLCCTDVCGVSLSISKDTETLAQQEVIPDTVSTVVQTIVNGLALAALNVAVPGGGIAGGAVEAATAAFASSGAARFVGGLAGEIANLGVAKIKADANTGSNSSLLYKVFNGTNGFSIETMTMPPDVLQYYDNYLSNYGHRTARIGTPRFINGKYFYYIQTLQMNVKAKYERDDGAYITSNGVPTNDIEYINSLFDNGTRFWKKDYAKFFTSDGIERSGFSGAIKNVD